MPVSPGRLSGLNPWGSTQRFDVFAPFDCVYSLSNIDTWLEGFNLLKYPFALDLINTSHSV